MDFFALATGACLGPPVTLGADFVALLHLLVVCLITPSWSFSEQTCG